MKSWLPWNSYWWDWLQVEVSSKCHAACIYCPTAIYPKDGAQQLMTMQTFQKLAPAFSRTRLVYLQGWGEPFMNPNFFEMVRNAKSAGCQVGVTTNGMLVNDGKLAEIVSSGVDIVTFSLAGCSKLNDSLRIGTHLTQVFKVVQRLKQIRGENGKPHPEIHIAYMLLRSCLDEIEQLPDLLTGQGVTQVVISTLDFVPSPQLERETLIPSSQEEYECWRERLDRLAQAGKQSGIDIRYQLATFKDEQTETAMPNAANLDFLMAMPVFRPTCTENIQRSAFISAGGDVSPCVFTRLPIGSPEVAMEQTGRPYQFMIFGNVGDQPLENIWKSKNYRKFRGSHHPGNLKGICQQCLKPRVQIH